MQEPEASKSQRMLSQFTRKNMQLLIYKIVCCYYQQYCKIKWFKMAHEFLMKNNAQPDIFN